jgi:2-keto-4-pentenoate hydratase/2-oxohepta-3-ene-1,7-dioic acid hydratase in catechol pathway
LELTTHVNGELRQKANTEQMIFSLEELVSELSQGITLRPGDMIATGTPSGVGMGFSPPRFLQKGDCVRMEIENIGVLQNLVTDA